MTPWLCSQGWPLGAASSPCDVTVCLSYLPLLPETKYLPPEIKGGRVYLAQFVVVSVHDWLAPRQRGVAEEKLFMAPTR